MTKCENCIHERVCDSLIQNGLPYNDDKFSTDKFCNHFKDKSLIVELPCRGGEVLYTHEYDCEREECYIEKVKCHSIEIGGDNDISIYCENIEGQYDTYVPDDFGECIFLTREEAEKALKEREQC